ncbi:predicted NBD/HSP70 family sugar kinase [Jatrophihabitans sp. GAS493]|uniref:ROK family transcriptional regulator n=1 Tax=Jatrophihabitans sp. GAS493 TaxID=1907575 RepID=UPI000BB97EC1|nr:ROK family transcriptional regulator [Jatrophihabitans sp. GAS493]SOD72970.1 predicted NBD/HSP70 family sugar kinase [Jatrophihabitans sp. GAS493]
MLRSAARPDDIRRHNLGLLLEEIHRHGELSRAELTQRLGLNRSTIGVLVADLTELGLVSEFVPSRGDRAGRPSHMVGPSDDGPFAVAVDIEVDRVASAAVGLTGQVLDRLESALEPSERGASHVAGVIATHIDSLIAGAAGESWPVGVGVSVPGTVTRDGLSISLSPNLNWRDLAFAAMITDRLREHQPVQLPIELGNDADLGVMAEHLRGAARDCEDVVYLTGRIGVGAGIVTNGVALRGHDGRAGEIGHVVLDPAGPLCHCGNRGCAETYIGQAAVLATVGQKAGTAASAAWLLSMVRGGDETAITGLRSIANPLGRTLANLVNVLNPQRVVLGGLLAAVIEVAQQDVEAALNKHAFDTAHGSLQLCGAGLGQDSSLMGAAELAFKGLLANPFSRP